MKKEEKEGKGEKGRRKGEERRGQEEGEMEGGKGKKSIYQTFILCTN